MSLEGIQQYLQTGPDSYFEKHLPACRCFSCRDVPGALEPLDFDEKVVEEIMHDSTRLSTGTLKRTPLHTWYDSGLSDAKLFVCWARGGDGLTYGEWLLRPISEVRPPDSGAWIGPPPRPPAERDPNVTIEYHGLPALVWHVLIVRGLGAIADAAGWVLGWIWAAAVALGRAAGFPFRVAHRFACNMEPTTLGAAWDASRTCAYCGQSVGATVTGCPGHGGINPRPTAPISAIQSAHQNRASIAAVAAIVRETGISAEEAARAFNSLHNAGRVAPPDSGGELTH